METENKPGMEMDPTQETEVTAEQLEAVLSEYRTNAEISDRDLAKRLQDAFNNSRGSGTWQSHEQNQ